MKILGTNDDNRFSWHHSRDTHFEAFEVVCDFVIKSIIEKEEVHFMKYLNKLYHAALYDIGGPEFDSIRISSDKLAAKLTKTYGDRIKIEYGNARRRNIISSALKNPSGMLRKEVAEELKAHSKIRDAAFMLRRAIMEAPRKLPDDLQLKDILDGEVDVPDLVHHFFTYLISGTDKRRGNVSAKRRRIEALCADTIFSTTAGNKKPAKHQILNRYGYCVRYNTVEELETELTYEGQSKKLLTPYGISLDPKLATGEISSGKDTLHDTVGIAHQIIAEEPSDFLQVSDDINSETENVDLTIHSESIPHAGILDRQTTTNFVDSSKTICRKRRRLYEPKGLDIDPYRKIPKLVSSELLPLDHPLSLNVPPSVEKAKEADILWMINLHVSSMRTPLWTGCNSLAFNDKTSVQKVWYLPQINQSPTTTAVVAETMNRALKIADESGRKSIAVTYDLAIAKVAMQIQATETPKYDNLFVNLGAFHVEMAFFKVMGKFIAESGGPYILNECDVLQKGSINGFIQVKSYNCGKRIHQLLAVAMEILHFRSFLLRHPDEDIDSLLTHEMAKLNKSKQFDNFDNSKELREIIDSYKLYKKETITGKQGLTAQYWLRYID